LRTQEHLRDGKKNAYRQGVDEYRGPIARGGSESQPRSCMIQKGEKRNLNSRGNRGKGPSGPLGKGKQWRVYLGQKGPQGRKEVSCWGKTERQILRRGGVVLKKAPTMGKKAEVATRRRESHEPIPKVHQHHERGKVGVRICGQAEEKVHECGLGDVPPRGEGKIKETCPIK